MNKLSKYNINITLKFLEKIMLLYFLILILSKIEI